MPAEVATATALLLTKHRLHRRSLLGPHWKLPQLATQTETSADNFFDSLRSQCHSATPECHPSPSPPTTRYLETIRFTDLLTLKLAAAQLCSAWHGLSLGSPSFSTRNHSQLDYFAFGPPMPCLPRSATQHRNGTSFHSSVRRRQYVRATPTALLPAAQSADVPYLPFSNKGSATGHSTLTSFSSSVAQDSTPDERQHDPLTSAPPVT